MRRRKKKPLPLTHLISYVVIKAAQGKKQKSSLAPKSGARYSKQLFFGLSLLFPDRPPWIVICPHHPSNKLISSPPPPSCYPGVTPGWPIHRQDPRADPDCSVPVIAHGRFARTKSAFGVLPVMGVPTNVGSRRLDMVPHSSSLTTSTHPSNGDPDSHHHHRRHHQASSQCGPMHGHDANAH